MRHNLYFSAGLLCLLAGVQAAYGSCPNGSNTTTSATFCSGTISTPNGGNTPPVASSPYPAPITVSGMNGAVSGVQVTISGWTYPNNTPDTLQLMLVAPGASQALVFFAGNCGTNSQNLSGFNLTLSDSASGVPPSGFNQDCTNNATYKPYVNPNETENGPCPAFPGATPSTASCANGSTTTFTSTFTGVSPNGTWNVYAQVGDDGENAGSLTINLNLTTEVTQSATTTSVSVNPAEIFNSSPNNASTFTATVTSGGNNVNEGEVQFYDNGATAGSPVAVSGGTAQLNDVYGPATPEGF